MDSQDVSSKDLNSLEESSLVSTSAPIGLDRPESRHATLSRNWPVIVAGVAVPLFALLVAVSFVLLPNIKEPTESTPTQQTEPTEIPDETSTTANPSEVPPVMRLMTVQNAVERGAICNDGSPAKYYFRPGTVENQDKWIIFFQGGGACSSEADCLARAEEEKATLLSSDRYPATLRENGILSSNPQTNQDFYNWNQVKLMYCSSDGWTGNGEQEIGGETWYFHGKTNVQAIIDDLQDEQITRTASLEDATQVLVAGSSAGGSGATNNLDDIATELSWADVKGFSDSSWSYDSETYNDTVPARDGEVRADIATFTNRSLDKTCTAAHPTDPGACTILSEVYPYLETPLFVFINQYDSNKMGNLGITLPVDAAEKAWLDTIFVPGMLESFAVVDDGLFSIKDTFHTMLTSERYFNTEFQGVTVQEAFINWYFGRAGETRVVEEQLER